MANQALYGSDQNGELYQEYNEALNKVREIITQQNGKLKQRISEVSKKIAKPNNNDLKRLISEKKKLECILKLLKDQNDAEESEDLIANEGEGIDEIREARKLLIDGLSDMENSNPIRVKIMGNLVSTPFYNAVKRYNNKEDALNIALNKCKLWTKRIRDPNWRPFKVVTTNGESVEVVNDCDEKLKMLKMEMGEKVYNAVVKALTEMNEYSPTNRQPVPELWNFSEDRKATLKEGITSILSLSEQRKRTRLLP